ncbi:MAG: uroporphyrinogen-III C-methyltransferase [Alphaproteobacteria bacterium]|jgi:uroporphyrin-III C-methyltransferase|nr:uroporphyrinogen-III C-methyltransferase [Alphaproteobacteria bacterium]MDP6565080.1 uroporphyrinogen-III C-methyltransferase [Alphaproteobacteria bacterium]MDP6813260.1 uroporphyrinogen-III C-methyltransferase [Alphaproteobacteria bacterium]
MIEDTADLPNLEPGWVWLVGAGPGDPGLLTRYAVRALGQADVVVYDALVGQGVLDLARPEAELEYAGKRGGKPSPKQPDISRRLIALAGEGRRVLRLKGGDPFIFGRGAEEGLALVEAGVPFRVVPGISAGIGGLAYAGIPVTHRGINSAVTFMTGHDASGDVPHDVDWPAIAKASPTIVLYMAVKHLGEIAAKLQAAGRPSGEPVALISRATTEGQQVVETTLGSCAEAVAREGLQPPAMVVIGENVRLRARLDWLGRIGEQD